MAAAAGGEGSATKTVWRMNLSSNTNVKEQFTATTGKMRLGEREEGRGVKIGQMAMPLLRDGGGRRVLI